MMLKIRSLVVAGLILATVLTAAIILYFDYDHYGRFPWEHPNVIFIVVDTLRADHVGAYSTSHVETPNIDRLADNGWLFEQAYTHIPITLPSHSALFTGRLPHEVGVYNNHDTFSYEGKTLAEIFTENGYKTAGIVSLGVLKRRFGIARGFEHYEDKLPGNGQWYIRADDITDKGIAWLQQRKDDSENPFFLWLHYSDPHDPYSPPDLNNDTSITVNGVVAANGVLGDQARLAAELKLKPGMNEVIINRLYGEESRQYLKEIYFSGDFVEGGPFPTTWRSALKESGDQNKVSFRKKLYELQSRVFLTGSDTQNVAGLELSAGHGWSTPDPDAQIITRSMTSRSIVNINNTTGKEVSVTFNIRGGMYKPVETIKEHYSQEVEFADQQIGRFLDSLHEMELDKNTVIVFLSDHGEELNDHGRIGHIHNLYRESTHVPLIINDPSHSSGTKEIQTRAGLRDVAPTVLDLARIQIPETMTGSSLLKYVRLPDVEQRSIYMQTFSPEAHFNKFALLEGNDYGQYMPDTDRLTQLEFYDLDRDPLQRVNLAFYPETPWLNSFISKLKNYSDSVSTSTTDEIVDDEQDEMLANLGYVMSSASSTTLDYIGVPAQTILDDVSVASRELSKEVEGVSIIRVDSQQIGTSQEAFHYIVLEIEIPPASTDEFIVGLQRFVLSRVVRFARQFPLRFIVRSQDTVVADSAFIGDPAHIKNLFAGRLLRLLLQNPLSFSMSTTFERIYPVLSDQLEQNAGLVDK